MSAPLLTGLLPNSVLQAFANYMDTRCLGDSLGVGGTPLEPPSKHTEVRSARLTVCQPLPATIAVACDGVGGSLGLSGAEQ